MCHQEDQEEEEDLGHVEGVVQHVGDETEDEQDLESHVDYQPRKKQHSLVLGYSGTCQTVADERSGEERQHTVSMKVSFTREKPHVPLSVVGVGHHGRHPDHL